MAKVLMPPQGGEKKLCLSLCAMSLFSVICAVLMVYFTAIIYLPAANVIHSKIEGIFRIRLSKNLIKNFK